MKKKISAILLTIFIFCSIYYSHQDLRFITKNYPEDFQSYYIPSSIQAKVFSLGYYNALSDLLYIWFLLYWDYYGKPVRYSYMEHTFEVMTDLDPKNQDLYVVSALFAFLPLKWDLIYKFLDKGIEKNPDNYIIPYDAGMYALFSEKNYERAVKYFTISFERNPNRTIIKNLLARALSRKGDLETALNFFEEIYNKYKNDNSKEGNYYRLSSMTHIWQLKNEINERDVANAIEEYRKKFNQNPPSLKVLVKEGFLKSMPKDPLGKDYQFNAKEGKIICLSKFDPKEIAGRW